MLTGENGILNKATTSREKTDMSSIKEQAEIAKEGAKIGNIAQGKQTTRDEIIDSIVNEMGIPKENVQGNLITTKDGQYEIMVKEDNTIEVVKKGQGYIDAEYKEPALESDFRWTTLENGTVRIYEYLGTETSLHIPDTIDEKPVTMLKMDKTNAGDSSGWVEGGRISKSGVVFKSVKIPDTVTEIGANSFDRSELESIKLPSKLTNIGPYSFNENKLKNIEIPDTVTVIGYSAFCNNEIEELKLSKNLTKIERFAFSENKIKEIEIPEGVTFIGDRAFHNNQATKIEIPKTVTTLEEGAFVQNNLEQIIYGRTSTGEEDRTVINSYAGRNAGNMIIPSGVKKIEPWAFSDVGLTSLEIPEGVTTIEGATFFGDNLQKLIIPSTITNVHMLSFSFSNIDYIEFKGNTFPNIFGVLLVDNITEIKVPYSEDHSVLEYYQGLIGSTIYAENIGSITEK